MQDFTNLKVWHRAHALALSVYRATGPFPQEEQYGLTNQIRRACVSVPANIAEGCGTDGNADFGRFLQMAMRSASELQYHLLLARDLGYLDHEAHTPLNDAVQEVKRMLSVLITKVRARSYARATTTKS